MGNFCCNEDLPKSLKQDDHHMEIEKSSSYLAIPLKNVHLDTVKEDPYENSEQSEYRTISRNSHHNN